MSSYTLKTERLGLRPWNANDLDDFTLLNANPEVMKFFPSTLNKKETGQLLERMQKHYKRYGFTYFAAELLTTKAFVGMIGMAHQEFESPYTPCVDIGWRLHPDFWGKGLATEGAQVCLTAAKNKWGLEKVFAFAPEINTGSIKVMEKLGMHFLDTFVHSKLTTYPAIAKCVAYST